jgi:hypothetical protein
MTLAEAALGRCLGSPEAVTLGNRLGQVEVGLCEVIASPSAATEFDRDRERLGRREAREGVMRSACGRQTPPPDYELTCVERRKVPALRAGLAGHQQSERQRNHQ